MADEDIRLEGAKLITFSPKAASGEESAKLAISFAVEVDTVASYMTRLTRIFRKGRSIDLAFSGLTIKSTELFTFSPKAAKVTKDGDEKEPPKMVLGFTVELNQVEEKLSRISTLWRTGSSGALSLAAIEQLELPKPSAVSNTSNGHNGNGNGHGTLDLKDTKPVDLAKTKSKAKKKQHQPI